MKLKHVMPNTYTMQVLLFLFHKNLSVDPKCRGRWGEMVHIHVIIIR